MKSLPDLEVHVPISPTPLFFNMLQCLVLSLRKNGGSYKNAPVIVTIGNESQIADINRQYGWLGEQGVEIRWVDAELFHHESWFATGIERYNHQSEADMFLILDADILICSPLDSLIESSFQKQSFSAMVAHYSPFGPDHLLENEIWDTLFLASGLKTPEKKVRYSAFPQATGDDYLAPNYFNFGVQCAPTNIMNKIGHTFYDMLTVVDPIIQEFIPDRYFFRCQIALTLIIEQLKIDVDYLSPRYNFPTNRDFEKEYPEEFAHICILHALGENIHKSEVYQSMASIYNVIQRTDLSAADEVQRRVLESIFEKIK